MDYIEKLNQAKELLLQAESILITEKGFCPYEIGYSLRSLDQALEQLQDGSI